MSSLKRRFYKLLAVFMSAVLLAGSAGVSRVSADTKTEIEDKKKEAEKNQRKTEKALESLKTDKANLQKYVKEIDEQLSALQKSIDELTVEIANLEQAIVIKTEELAVAKENEAIQYENMQKRIQFLYENGNMDYLEAMMSASSMSSILNRSEYVTQISEFDYNMLMSLIAIRREIADAEKLLEEDKLAAEEKKTESQEQHATLEAIQKKKQEEIKKTQMVIDDTMEAIEEYEKEVAKYDAELEAIEKQAIADGGGDYTGGPLGWPCPASHRISSGFGPRNTGIKGASKIHKGIDIPVATGSSAVAAESGTVIAVSYNSARGYYCMVNHGGGLTTLYQHCSRITVSVGQQVARGEEVAKTGSTGISSGPHLHFEVRINGTPVNPLNYVK